MFKHSIDLNQMKNEDQQYGEPSQKKSSSKNRTKNEKYRQDFKKMTTQDFAQMSDDYDDEE